MNRRRKKKADNGEQEKSEWWKFVLTAIIPILFTAAAMYYEHWRVVHSVRCSYVSATHSDDKIKVRFAFENEGTESEVILGASFCFPQSPDYKSHSSFGAFDEDILYQPHLFSPFVLKPGDVEMATFEWPASYQSLSQHFSNTNRFETEVGIRIIFLDANNHQRCEIFPGLILAVEDVLTHFARFEIHDIDLFDDEGLRFPGL
jgi:hypothetical protein